MSDVLSEFSREIRKAVASHDRPFVMVGEPRALWLEICDAIDSLLLDLEDKTLCKEGFWYCRQGEEMQRKLDSTRKTAMEEAARICDEKALQWDELRGTASKWAAHDCAAAIRAACEQKHD